MKENNITILSSKDAIRKTVLTTTMTHFKLLQTVLENMVNQYNEALFGISGNARTLESKVYGDCEIELNMGNDILIFSLQPSVFCFDKNHLVRRLPYVKQNSMNAFCGIINIYNFLSDSITKNRVEDLGYLVGRIFINHESSYFVEGKRQNEHPYHAFGSVQLDAQRLNDIVDAAIFYTLEFDPLVPQYDAVKILSVGQILAKIETSTFPTAKRIGFEYRSDDVLNVMDTK